MYKVPMNQYECPFCPGKFVVGNMFAANGKKSRSERQEKTLDNFEQQGENSESYGQEKQGAI